MNIPTVLASAKLKANICIPDITLLIIKKNIAT